MSLQVVAQGTLKADGTLELDERLPLPAGRVQVTVQPTVQPSASDPFWTMMESIWEGQRKRGFIPRSTEAVEAERHKLREEAEEEVQELIRLHQQGHKETQGPPSK